MSWVSFKPDAITSSKQNAIKTSKSHDRGPAGPVAEASRAIREEALRLGFTDCGFSRAEPLEADAARLREWLDHGYHAGMGYMARNFEKRTDPTLLVEGARSVVSLLYNYYTADIQEDPAAPVLSKYAFGKDYHFILREKMRLLLEFIRNRFGPVGGRAFVDSAPVLDRAWARKAGLGWIGKNSMLISRRAGSFVFIGELILDIELDYNQVPEGDYCGSCNQCVEACPTVAILPNRTIDAQRCISYQTIENKEGIPGEIGKRLTNRLFGCDICQDVCPWNRRALRHRETRFEPAGGLLEMSAADWKALDREQYQRLFKGSALKRAGFPKIRDTLRLLSDD